MRFEVSTEAFKGCWACAAVIFGMGLAGLVRSSSMVPHDSCEGKQAPTTKRRSIHPTITNQAPHTVDNTW